MKQKMFDGMIIRVRATLTIQPKYYDLEWYSPCLDLEHTIQVCRGEWVRKLNDWVTDLHVSTTSCSRVCKLDLYFLMHIFFHNISLSYIDCALIIFLSKFICDFIYEIITWYFIHLLHLFVVYVKYNIFTLLKYISVVIFQLQVCFFLILDYGG